MIVAVGQTGQMDQTYRLERARQDGERIVELCATHMGAAVPSCPDWDGAGLLSHVTRVWHMLAIICEDGREGFPGRDDFPPRPAEGDEVAGATAALDRVIAAMRALEPGAAMWSWGTTQSSDYFFRRLHLENLVHRVDGGPHQEADELGVTRVLVVGETTRGVRINLQPTYKRLLKCHLN